MNNKTRTYLTDFVTFLYTDLLTDTNKVHWNPIQESDQTIQLADSKVLITSKIYRTADSRVMIKTTSEVLSEQVKSISFTVCSNTINLLKESDKLTLAILKLISLLDVKLEQVNLSGDTQSYIDSLLINIKK